MNFDWDKDATWLRVFEPKVICSSQENDNDNSGSDNEKTNVISTVFGGKCVIDIEGLE
jgi:hypothetical protein